MGIREQALWVLEGLAFLRVQDPTDAQSNVTPAQQEKKPTHGKTTRGRRGETAPPAPQRLGTKATGQQSPCCV